jgi:hypothetical protein
MFSTILDISSFFIGMLINLLLIALICYYFKRKYEILEQAQNEQAKIIYNLIQKQVPQKTFDINELMATHISAPEIMDDEESDDEDSDDDEPKIKHLSLIDSSLELNVEQIEQPSAPLIITKINEPEDTKVNTEADYSKMSMKQLKEILSQKGIQSNPRMKKNELINLIENGPNTGETQSTSVEEMFEVII